MCLHDGDVVCSVERDVVQLGDEDRGHGDKEGGPVHVDGGSDGQHELPNALVHPGSVETLQSDRQCGGPEYDITVANQYSVCLVVRLTLMP